MLIGTSEMTGLALVIDVYHQIKDILEKQKQTWNECLNLWKDMKRLRDHIEHV